MGKISDLLNAIGSVFMDKIKPVEKEANITGDGINPEMLENLSNNKGDDE